MKTILKLAFLLALLTIAQSKAQTWKELMDSANYYKEMQDYEKALMMAQKSLFLADKEISKLDTNYVNVLSIFPDIYESLGNLDSAIFYAKTNLELCRQIYKTDHSRLATSISWLAYLYNEKGIYDLTEPLMLESLEMNRRLYKGDHPDLAQNMNNLAGYYYKRGNYNKAEALYKESLEMNRRLYKSDNPELAQSLNNIASLYHTIGDYDRAEPIYIESMEMRRRLFKQDNPALTESINNLGILYSEVGDFRRAEPLLMESLNMKRRLYKSDHPDLAHSLNNMGYFYYHLGDNSKAEQYLIEALEMRKKLYHTDHPDLARSLKNLATFYEHLKDYGKAVGLFKESYEMFMRIFKNDHPFLADILNNLAGLYIDKSQDSLALPLLKQTLEMRRRIFKTNHPDLANSINNLGFYYAVRRDYARGIPLMQESIAMYRQMFRSGHPDLARTINNLAIFYKIKGDLSEAEIMFIESLDMYSDFILNYFPALSEEEKDKFWNKYKWIFESFYTFVIKRMNSNPSILNYSYNLSLLTKGILLSSSQKVRLNILNSGNNNLINKLLDWQACRTLISKLSNLSLQQLKNKKINLDSLIYIANAKEKELCLLSDDFNYQYKKKASKWNDVLRNLKPEEAAIEMLRFRQYQDNKFTDTIYYAALIVKDTSSVPELVLLNNGNDLEGKYIEEYRNQAGQFKKRVYDPDKVNDKLKELYSQFWAPIQEKLKGIKTVYLSPDGVYNLLNLNTLINPETGKYLLEEIDLRLVTSTRDLVERNPQSASFSKGGREVSIAELFGDPQFDLDSTKYELLASNIRSSTTREYYSLGNTLDSATRGAIASLPGTRKEIENIDGSFQKQGWKVNRHLGPEALEEALKAVDNPRVLHIATHGKFLKDVERRDDERMMGFETQRFIENPLLRSMLLFSGAENTLLNQGQHSATQREDGLLTAYEAQNLNLDNTELVVLSACETGLGEIKNGEGVYGLQRAFQVAGAKSLIMSLWSVSDEATQELMASFYSKWLEGKSKREAFREAQMELKKKYPGFYYWGAFVMVGE